MFFLFVLIFLLFIIIYCILVVISTLKIEIYNAKLSTEKINNSYINDNYKIVLSLCVFSIKIFKINITKAIFDKQNIKKEMESFKHKFKENKDSFDIKTIKLLKDLNIKVNKINLDVAVGIENAEVTAILVGIISTIIANLINKIEDQKFIVSPIYDGRNMLKVKIESIITIKTIHIIYMIYVLEKNRRKENVRTSDRGPYVNSYE